MNKNRYVAPGIYTIAPNGYIGLSKAERQLRMLYRDILKYGFKVVSVTKVVNDYIINLELRLPSKDWPPFTVESCYRLKAQ